MTEKSTLKFLKDLAANDNRDWFQANKKLFDAAQDNLTAFAGYLIGEIGKFDDAVAAIDPKSCVFRKGFDADHRAVEYLKLKEFMVFADLHDDRFLTSSEFPKYLVGLMKEMYPLVAFLRKTLV